MNQEDRRGPLPGRRRYPDNDMGIKCLWCDDKDELSKERWAEHRREDEEHRLACQGVVKELKKTVASSVPWKFFYIVVGIAMGAIGWLSVDHFGLSKTVATNTGILKIMVDNQADMMKAMGLKPKIVDPSVSLK